MRKVDFTNLIDGLSEAKDLIDPEVQLNHPAMQELFQILAYNLMDDGEQAIYDRHVSSGSPLDPKTAFRALGEQGGDNHTKEEMQDTLYTGLMTDQQYQDFQDDKAQEPSLTAKAYYNRYIKQYANPGMNKLAKIFDMYLNEKPPEKLVKFISKEEFTAMNPKDREKNYDRAIKSSKRW